MEAVGASRDTEEHGRVTLLANAARLCPGRLQHAQRNLSKTAEDAGQ
jgi:hypothetical protein